MRIVEEIKPKIHFKHSTRRELRVLIDCIPSGALINFAKRQTTTQCGVGCDKYVGPFNDNILFSVFTEEHKAE